MRIGELGSTSDLFHLSSGGLFSGMDIAQASPLKVFLKNNLFSDVVLHVYKINNPMDDEDKIKQLENVSEDLVEDGCPRKKRRTYL